jgi:hypothetical protein
VQGEIQKKAPNFFDAAFQQSFSQRHSDYDRDAILERDLKEIARIHRENAMQELVNILASWS